MIEKNDELIKQAYIDWLDSMEWSFWCTLTTPYELTVKSARRAILRYHAILSRISNKRCRIFFVLEPFGIKEGMHIHCLISMPDKYHEPDYYQQMVDSWQLCTGRYKRVKDERGCWVEQQKARIDLKRYRKDIKATGYCSKYMMKDDIDYDLLDENYDHGE